MKINTATKKAIEKRFSESFGVMPYSIEKVSKDGKNTVYYVQSKFNEMEIEVNALTGEAIRH
jgi:ribosomal protein L23